MIGGEEHAVFEASEITRHGRRGAGIDVQRVRPRHGSRGRPELGSLVHTAIRRNEEQLPNWNHRLNVRPATTRTDVQPEGSGPGSVRAPDLWSVLRAIGDEEDLVPRPHEDGRTRAPGILQVLEPLCTRAGPVAPIELVIVQAVSSPEVNPL